MLVFKFEYDSFVVLTKATDVLVLLQGYCTIFLIMKLRHLYIKTETGTTTQYLPIHEFANTLGEKQCRNLLKAHIVTGCDWLSNLGTKSNVLHKVDLLKNFGERYVIGNALINPTEEYLMSSIKGKDIPFKSFDEYKSHQHVTYNTPI